MNKVIKKNSIIGCIKYIILFLLIYCSFESLLFGTNILPLFQVAMAGIYIILELVMLLLVFITHEKISFDKNTVLTSATLIGLIFLTQIYSYVTGYSLLSPQYFYNVLLIIMACTMTKLYSRQAFEEMFVNIMYWLSIAGIGIYVINMLGVSLPHIVLVNRANSLFYHYLVAAQLSGDYTIPRLYGVFREPGVLGVYVSLAVFFELFRVKKISLLKIGVFIIATLLTFSTAGYITVGVLALAYLLSVKNNLQKFILILLSIIVLCFGLTDQVNQFVFGKFYTANNSLNSRIYSLYGGFVLSVQGFFLGHGWDYIINNFTRFIDRTYYITDTSFTNTYLRMACTYGWIFTSVVLVYTLKFLKRHNISIFQLILITIAWFCIFSNENFLLNLIIYVILFLKEAKYENLAN